MQTHLANRMDGLNGSAIREIFKLLGDPSIISFAGGNPSVKSFPSIEGKGRCAFTVWYYGRLCAA